MLYINILQYKVWVPYQTKSTPWDKMSAPSQTFISMTTLLRLWWNLLTSASSSAATFRWKLIRTHKFSMQSQRLLSTSGSGTSPSCQSTQRWRCVYVQWDMNPVFPTRTQTQCLPSLVSEGVLASLGKTASNTTVLEKQEYQTRSSCFLKDACIGQAMLAACKATKYMQNGGHATSSRKLRQGVVTKRFAHVT